MPKLTLNDITAGHGSADLYNGNNDSIEAAIENTLSRDGTSPNQMEAALDMNGFAILNAANFATDFNVRGDWTTATAYSVGDVVYVPIGTGSSYDGYSLYAQTAHTSGTLDTDFASGYWVIVAARGETGASGGLDANNNLSDLDNLTVALNNLLTAHGPLDTADIGDDTITVAKIADGTDGELLTWDSSGEATTIPVGTSGQVLTSNGAGAEPTWQDSTSTAASQAQMEGASSNTVFVTPGRQQYHPGMAKAWVKFAGASGAISASYNVSSVSRGGTGTYTVNFTNAFSSSNYCAIVSMTYASASGTLEHHEVIESQSSSSCGIGVRNFHNQRSDPTTVYAVFFGDQ